MGESYESFYTGGYSSMSPDYGGFVGYRLNASTIGSPTSIQTANQISEVLSRIREGVKNVEVQTVSPDVFDQIPKEQFKEIAAISKLTGVKPSMHAPIIDPAGFGEKGWEGDKAREDAEARIFSSFEKSHELDPKGNVPVAIHSSAGIPGYEYMPDKDKKPGEAGRFKERRLILIDQDTKQMTQVEEERKYYPTNTEEENLAGGKLRVPRKEVEVLNRSDWDNKMTNLAFYKKEAQEVMKDYPLVLAEHAEQPATNEVLKNLSQEEQISYSKLRDADLFLDNIEMSFASLFHKAYKFGDEKQREKLQELGDEYKKKRNEQYIEVGDHIIPKIGSPVIKLQYLDNAIKRLHDITSQKAPEVYKPVEEFAMEKAAETFGNVAWKAYDKFKESAPIMAIENMYQGMAFSKADDMKKLIDESKKVFVKNAVKKGMSEGSAKQEADKLIGVTWDVGHLNMMKKHGFTDEDIIKETEKIAKNIKHVHITDNFGYSDSHLPPGMGNVPFKQILEKMEKAGVLDKTRKIVEAGGFVQHFKKSPHPFVMSAFGSPIYGAKMAPYWNQAAETFGGYFAFPMAYLPEKHFSMYGTGFSGLPEELGGQIPGTQSRFSGTPNA